MNRFLKVRLFLFAFIVLAAALLFHGLFDRYIEKRHWIQTTASIEFVGAPDGAVFGSFLDCNQKEHKNVLLYYDFFKNVPWSRHGHEAGEPVVIMYDPSGTEAVKYSLLVHNIVFPSGILLLLLASFILMRILEDRSVKKSDHSLETEDSSC